MKRCAFLSTDDLTGFVTDDDLAIAPLRALGWAVDYVPWRADVDWDVYRLRALCDELSADEIVIKPVIGANADHAYRLPRDAAAHVIDEVARVYAGRGFLAQPFLHDVVTEGEFSLIYFAGELSHTILKTPKPGDFRVQEEHGGLSGRYGRRHTCSSGPPLPLPRWTRHRCTSAPTSSAPPPTISRSWSSS